MPSGTGSAARASPRYFCGSAANFVRQPAGAEVIGVALVGVAMRRRVRVDRHPADGIERTFPGFGALVMVIVAMPGVMMAAVRRAISRRVSLFGHGAQSLVYR